MVNKAWDCNECRELIQREFIMDCDACGQGMSEEELNTTLLGLTWLGSSQPWRVLILVGL